MGKKKTTGNVKPIGDAEGFMGGLQAQFSKYERRILELEHERDSAVAERNAATLPSSEGDTTITADALEALGMWWYERNMSWVACIGRLSLHVRVNGDWSIHFDSTYGGSIGNYRKLKSMEEVHVFISLLGCQLPHPMVSRAHTAKVEADLKVAEEAAKEPPMVQRCLGAVS